MRRNLFQTLSIVAVLALLVSGAFLLSTGLDESDAVGGDTATLRFEIDSTGSDSQLYYVRVGNTVELPTMLFEKDGSYLAGWTDGKETYSPGGEYTVTGDARLTAVWATPNYDRLRHCEDVVLQPGEEYSVSLFATSDDLSGEIEDITVPSWFEKVPGTSDSLPAYTGSTDKPGIYLVSYTKSLFLGINATYCWYTITVPSDMDGTYTVSYDLNGGSGSIEQQFVAKGTGLVLPGEDSTSWASSGTMHLVGWNITDADGNRGLFPLDSLYIFDSDAVVEAQWESNPHVLVYSMDGGSLENVYAIVTWGDEPVSLRSDAVKPGYIFLGWRVSQDPDLVYAPGLLVDLDEATYLEAYFVPEGTELCGVTFDAGLGSTAITTQQLESGRYVMLPTYQVQYDGYDFVGWSTEPPIGNGVDDGRQTIPTEHLQITEDTTLYAVYHDSEGEEPENPDDPEMETYRVIFDANGGDSTYPVQYVEAGGRVSAPSEPMKDGCIFLGWAVIGTTDPWDFQADTVQYDITLRAMWADAFTIAYSETDERLPVVTLTVDPAYVGSERIDVYWGSPRDGSETVYNGTASHTYHYTTWGYIVLTITIDGIGHTSRIPFSVSAEHYNPTVEHMVYFDSAGGSYVEPQTVIHGECAFRPVDPTKDGMVFDGWFYGGLEWDFTSQITMDITLTAHWTDEPVTDPEGPDTPTAFFTITRIADGWFLDGSKSVGVMSYEWWLDGEAVGDGMNLILDYDDVEEGTHTVQLCIEGIDGKRHCSGTQSIVRGSSQVTPIQPTAAFTVTPEDGGWLLDASGSRNATRYVWYLDGDVLAGETGTAVHLSSNDLADGTHEVVLVVYSNTENSDSHRETIVVEHRGDDDSGLDIDWPIIAIVIVIVILLIAIAWRFLS